MERGKKEQRQQEEVYDRKFNREKVGDTHSEINIKKTNRERIG